LSGTEKLSPLFVEVQQVEDGSVFLDGAFSFRSTFLVARWLQGSVSPKAARFFIVALTVAAPYEAVNEFATRGNWFLPSAFQLIHTFIDRRYSFSAAW